LNVVLLNITHRHVSAAHLQSGENKHTVTINVSGLSEWRFNTLPAILFLFWPRDEGTCGWLLCNEIRFINSSAFVGPIKKLT
jgi:hypothetical protein